MCSACDMIRQDRKYQDKVAAENAHLRSLNADLLTALEGAGSLCGHCGVWHLGACGHWDRETCAPPYECGPACRSARDAFTRVEEKTA